MSKLVAAIVTAALIFCGSIDVDAHSSNEHKKQRSVAVVIDDFGNGMTGTDEMMRLPIHFTAAIMPFMPTTKRDAKKAHQLGHEVIVHMPMEPNKGKKEWLGPGAITTDLSDTEIRKRIEAAIHDVPYAVGMNNHMGSKVTADERVMRVILSVCKEHGFYFLDSRTTHRTVVPKIAEELGVPLISNNIFLDDVYSVQHISKQIELLRKYLGSQENCVTIGHVGPSGKQTASVLQRSIPDMKQSINFVKISDMLHQLMNDPLKLPNS